MKLTVKTDSEEVTKEFHSDILLWDALKEMGVVLDRPCGGRGVCGNCQVIANGEPVRACITHLEEDTVVEDLPLADDVQVVTAGYVPTAGDNALVKHGYGPEGKTVKTVGMVNTQAQHGADVVTRMEYALKGGAIELQQCLEKQIGLLTGDAKIEKYVITCNTTMLHFLTGNSTQGMSCAPYIPESLFGQWYGDMYLPKCISAFVGADITCAVLASGMLKQKTALLVDIGTNGEMVLWHKGKLLCCSAAAGPAFEGAEISQGMLAESGAINKVYLENGVVKYTTIGGCKAKGICGSGLIDAIAVMLKLGVLDDTGYLEEPFAIADSEVYITPEDVRQVQLAKAAIRAGMETLLHEAGCSYEELECFYIAGGFGSYIDKVHGAAIGLFPEELLSKVSVIGNAAGTGASMILNSQKCLEESRRIAEMAMILPLADSTFFAEMYVQQMLFESE